MAESRAYQRLKRFYPSPATHWQRLESWTGTGIFDVNGCRGGREIWVECKEGYVKRDGYITVSVRDKQVPWEALRSQAGGFTFIAVVFENKMNMIIFPGHRLAELRDGDVKFDDAIESSIDIKDIFNYGRQLG